MKYNKQFWMWLAILFCGLTVSSCTFDNPVYQEPVQTTVDKFFNAEVNKLIDENYAEVQAKGHAKLVIPRTLYPEGMFTFPKNASSDMQYMVAAGYKAYVNGGTVRDGVMGTASHDVDFSTNASIDQIVATVPNAKSFNAFKNIWVVKAYHDGDIETDIAPIFSIFPEYGGKGNVPVTKFPDSPYCDDLLEDTYSRDFTFNSLYYDYATGDIIDYHGGLHDLREGIVKSIITPDIYVANDGRSIFRGLRFSAKYDFRIDDDLSKAYVDHIDALGALNTYNSIYQTESGFNSGFSLKFFKLLEQYKVTDFFLTSLKDRLQTPEYKNLVEGMLGEFDKGGKADFALIWAAIFWPRVADELKAKANPTKADIAAIWEKIDKENAANFKFEYNNYTYVPQFMQDVWYLQTLLDSTTDPTTELKAMDHYAEAQRFFEARAQVSLRGHVD